MGILSDEPRGHRRRHVEIRDDDGATRLAADPDEPDLAALAAAEAAAKAANEAAAAALPPASSPARVVIRMVLGEVSPYGGHKPPFKLKIGPALLPALSEKITLCEFGTEVSAADARIIMDPSNVKVLGGRTFEIVKPE